MRRPEGPGGIKSALTSVLTGGEVRNLHGSPPMSSRHLDRALRGGDLTGEEMLSGENSEEHGAHP
jgi:hypothetical protein